MINRSSAQTQGSAHENKNKKTIKYTLLDLLAVLIVGALGMTLWSITGTYPVEAVAQAALNSTDRVAETQDHWITFKPVDEVEEWLIFYPGGLVEPSAYAPVLHQIASTSA